jgi:putative tryptophan/tyrosine transport system substrate-binding protein
MKRREFITLLGGAAVGWPLAARAQQPNQMRRIGVLMAIEADDPLRASYVGALLEGLRTFDWVEGRNIQLKYGWAGGSVDRIKKLAKELAASRLDAILAHTSPVTLALKSETTTTPIIFVAVTEPVAQGMITSLAHPGGNITGFTNFEFSMGGKWLQILKEIVPKTNQATVMFNPDTAPGAGDIFLRSIDASAKSLAIGVTVARVRDPAEIEAAISALSKSSSAGLIVPPDVFLLVHRDKIIELAARYRVPTIYQYDNFTMGGGLVSYGVDVPDMFRRAGSYFDRILKGVSPTDLPIQAPTKFKLVINVKTAKALGLTVPPSLLGTADEVIE